MTIIKGFIIKALITGSNGFVGQWLARELMSEQVTVFGIDLQKHSFLTDVTYHQCDLLDTVKITSLIKEIQPDYLYNLAGISFLPDAAASPHTAMNANISGVMTILDAVRNVSSHTKVLLVGTSREYPYKNYAHPLSENSPVNPTNFYGISKLCGELTGLQYHRQFGIDVRCTRSFNHTGPGQSPRFVCSEWAEKIAHITTGQSEPALSVGGLDTSLDFSDVRDVVSAYRHIMIKGKPGEVYNVCSSTGTSLKWILDYLIERSSCKISINTSTAKVRSNDKSVCIIGNHQKLTAHTGWIPSVPLTKTLDDLFTWWLDQLTR